MRTIVEELGEDVLYDGPIKYVLSFISYKNKMQRLVADSEMINPIFIAVELTHFKRQHGVTLHN